MQAPASAAAPRCPVSADQFAPGAVVDTRITTPSTTIIIISYKSVVPLCQLGSVGQ